MQTLNGVYLEGEELREFKERAFNYGKFDEFLSTINQQLDNDQTVTKESLMVERGYKGDIELEKDYIVSAKQVIFTNKSKTVKMAYHELINYDVPESLRLVAQVLTTDKANLHYLLSVSINEEGNIEIETLSADYPETQLPDINEPLPNDPDYIPQDTGNLMAKDDSDEFTTQAWWNSDGCLPGGYQHCGGNCGYGLDHGGGTPINYTDRCCILHDRCYGDGITKCKCNTMLVKCVRDEVTWAAIGIRLYFEPRSC
ncbi:hypothetical protein [Bacillus swezeyi]|uniref:Phospholipase n=1 Tax=Bacillus swezeyi TaxID=1925020 RepID=A0A5M8S3M4_9BACI|nr:hypothetical protein [Bacillus swezeyi]KAA6452742.1 hypothetical protein DX927_00505 [Bacillus swezeyi]TYS38107.1 hypothetical protein FZC77_00440 [Bacillus swezeyi]